MTVLSYFHAQVQTNQLNARNAPTHSLTKAYLADAEKWQARMDKVSMEVGGRDVDEVHLWRIMEEVDRMKLPEEV